VKEIYEIELMDGEWAEIEVEQVEETMANALDRWTRTPEPFRTRHFDPSTVTLGRVWRYTIRITTPPKEMYGERVVDYKRHALTLAVRRLDRDEGLMPGAGPRRKS
jgi:hypothetical protein